MSATSFSLSLGPQTWDTILVPHMNSWSSMGQDPVDCSLYCRQHNIHLARERCNTYAGNSDYPFDNELSATTESAFIIVAV
jgi:hypothetical protein